MKVLTWLVHAFDDPLAGVYYVIAANVLLIASVLCVKADRISVPAPDVLSQSA